jgi:multidrug efflux system membrane fusion protein
MTAPRSPHASYRHGEHTMKKRPFYRQGRFWKIVVLVLIVLLLFRHCTGSHKTKAPKGQPVVVATAKKGDVPVYLNGLGTVTPTYNVTVRTQINGQLLQVLFKEGQMVKVGDLLAQVDPRPYEALLVQYQGQLERDTALLANAKLDLQRYKTLWSQDSVAKQTYDTQASVVNQDQGTVKIDQGLIQSTLLSLTYCRITSPVAGRVGLRLVDAGNYVQTSDTTGLAILDTLDPITVIFILPEDNIPEVQEQIGLGQPLVVDIYNRAQTKLLVTGTLMTIDNQIDTTTGTVKLRSQFPNPKNVLFPNQFVNARLHLKTLHDAIIVPTAAVQHGAQKTFVYAVASDDKESKSKATNDKSKPTLIVTMKPIVVGVTTDDETTVTSGVSAGDVLVVEGADKLSDGAKVIISDGKVGGDEGGDAP